MNDDDFSRFHEERLVSGQRTLADAMRRLLKRSAPEIFGVVSDLDDAFFLEPALFTHFARSERDSVLGLGQILFGRLPPARRPEAIEVDSDRHGRVYLPGIGVLRTDQRAQTLLLIASSEGLSLRAGRSSVGFALEPEDRLDGTAIELVRHEDPTLLTRFYDVHARPADAVIDGRAGPHRAQIERALALLSEHCPAYARDVARVTRRLVVFGAVDVNSFATINAHGAAFFNALDADAEPYFADELVHQCGHIIFNAVSVRRHDFLALDPELPLEQIAPRERSGRKLYDALHGLYTEDVMCACLRVLDERGVFTGRQAHELFGRLAFIARKFRIDLDNLSAPGVFTPLGRELYELWRQRCDRLARERPELWQADLRGQPYNFDAELFARNNPARSTPRVAHVAC